jgi:hypothetical protein
MTAAQTRQQIPPAVFLNRQGQRQESNPPAAAGQFQPARTGVIGPVALPAGFLATTNPVQIWLAELLPLMLKTLAGT